LQQDALAADHGGKVAAIEGDGAQDGRADRAALSARGGGQQADTGRGHATAVPLQGSGACRAAVAGIAALGGVQLVDRGGIVAIAAGAAEGAHHHASVTGQDRATGDQRGRAAGTAAAA
jgi:hypothetical protein